MAQKTRAELATLANTLINDNTAAEVTEQDVRDMLAALVESLTNILDDSTAAGRAVLSAADAAAQRTALELGSLATQSGTFSGTSSGTNTGDQDLSGLMVKSANLSDVANAATALANLGSLFASRAAKTGTYNVVAGDRGKCIDATSGTWSLTLTSAATLGDGFACAVFNSGSGVITIDPDSTETIRDATSSATTKTLAQGEGGILVCDGTGFLFLKVAAGGGIGGSAGSVDNAVLRADGTGGLTAQGSVLFVGDETAYSSQYYVSVSAGGAQTNNHLVLTPKGTGAFILGPPPDGTATGGNNRGTNAVDLSTTRLTASNVASGVGSAVLGGYRNTASGQFSVTAGAVNTATSDSCVAVGYITTASGQWGAFSHGYNTLASGAWGSRAGGDSCVASGRSSSADGVSSSANKHAQRAHAGGQFAAAGDAQFSRLVMRNSTSSTSPTNLFLDGASALLTIPNNTTWVFEIYIVGRTATATLNSYGYKLEGVVEKGTTAGSVAIVGTVTKTVLAEDNAAADVDATADTTNGALDVLVTAADSTATRWVASVHLTEVAYA